MCPQCGDYQSDFEPTGHQRTEQEFLTECAGIAQNVTSGTTSVHNVDMAKKKASVQVLSRAAALLRVVSSAMPEGLTTSDAARTTGIARPTAHRILDSLATEGFCDQDVKTGRWLLGPELFLMGNIAGARYDVTELAQKHVHALAQQTEESAFFSTLRGNEAVCLVREDGAFPIRSFVLYEGRRFPLGVASAGLAMLAFMPQYQVEEYLTDQNLAAEYSKTHAADAIRERIAEGRQHGYVTNPGLIVEGSWGMAAPVFDTNGYPAGALSLTGIEQRFQEPRRTELGKSLMHHAHELSQKLQHQAWNQR